MMPSLPSPKAGRIAIVSHVHPSISKGGAELSAYAVYQGLCALGHDAIFIAAVPEDRRNDVAFESAREFAIFHDPTFYDHFYHLAAPSCRDQLVDIIEKTQTRFVNFQHFMNLGVNTIRAVASLPDVVTLLTLHEYLAICHNHGQMITRSNKILCEMSSVPACLACYPENSSQQFAIRHKHFLDAFARIDGFISPSRFLAKRYVDWGIPPDRLLVIENGLNRVPPTAPPRPRRAGDRTWTFGYFGQITPFKGLSTILEVADLIAGFEELPERIRLRIHGNMVGQSQAFLDQLAETVARYPFLSYAGAYDNRDVPRLMAECDYVLVPSIWWENSPVVIQEAYAVGRPVICSGIGGMAEKVTDGATGLHFTTGDPVDLLRAIEIAANPDVFDKLREQLPAATDAAKMATDYLDAFTRWSTDSDQMDEPAET